MMQGLPPRRTPVSQPFWTALAREAIVLPICRACARFFFYPRYFCPHCGSRDTDWQSPTESATLHSFTIAEVPVSAAFAHLTRPVLAVAELHGVHLPTTVVDSAAKDLLIGAALIPVFDHAAYPNVTLLRFRLAPGN